jgi:pilus assembly protein CpaE
MNAPWNAGELTLRDSLATREPFAAFICDELSTEVLRDCAADLGWPTERIQRGSLRAAVQSLSIAASPSILMVDLSECADPMADIQALAEVCEPGTMVIAIGELNDVELYRGLLASGIHDYLLKPLAPAQVSDAIAAAQAALAAPRQTEAPQVRQHLATAVIGTRGGVGASMLATSLAWISSTEFEQPTALLDLDIHFGTGALVLDLEPGRGLTDAIENPARIDGLFIERAMIRANDHLSILSAEAPIAMPLTTDGAAFLHLEEEFRNAFAMTVVDLPRSMLVNFPQLLAEVGVVVLVTELTLAGARDAIRLLSWLKSHAGHAKVVLVANKVQAGACEIDARDFEASIERRIDFTIPFDTRAAIHAAKLGQTFAEANHNGRLGDVLHEIALAVQATGDTDLAAQIARGPRKSLLARLDPRQLLGRRKRGKTNP